MSNNVKRFHTSISTCRKLSAPIFVHPRFILPALALVSLCTLGCGDGRPMRVPVSGKVLVDGTPATRGSLSFYPESGQGRPSSAAIKSDGSFTVYTFEKDDGIPPGTYDVTVLAMETIGPEGEEKIRYHIPKKYADRTTAGITKTIEGPTDSMLIELTWDGVRGPVVESAN